jgi:hypothetical protein
MVRRSSVDSKSHLVFIFSIIFLSFYSRIISYSLLPSALTIESAIFLLSPFLNIGMIVAIVQSASIVPIFHAVLIILSRHFILLSPTYEYVLYNSALILSRGFANFQFS